MIEDFGVAATNEPLSVLGTPLIHDKRVVERAREPLPKLREVVSQSTPVVSFGDPRIALVATLGINPSSNEFIVGGRNKNLLAGSEKRLLDRNSLGISNQRGLTEDEAVRVIEACYGYFGPKRKPYEWFKELQQFVLDPLALSYQNGTACHLDVVQWATDPVWGGIKQNVTTKELLAHDEEFLRYQLTTYKFKYIFLNGGTVLEQVKSLGLVKLKPVGSVDSNQNKDQSVIYFGEAFGITFYGWGINIGYRATYKPGKLQLTKWLSENVEISW